MKRQTQRAMLLLAFSSAAVLAHAQTETPVTTNNGTPPPPATAPVINPGVPMPSAPAVPLPSTTLPGTTLPATEGVAPTQQPQMQQLPPNLLTAPVVPANAESLTVSQAEQKALAANPRIAISRLLALVQGQVTRETRAADYPTIGGAVTGVGANNGSRIAAGALNNPVLYSRAAAGLTLNQLLTDFGRTHNLVQSAELHLQASQSTEMATRDDIVFAVDQAFYRALGAQALIDVAKETVDARQAVVNQITALTKARLRSTLDLSFAQANLAQAQLTLLDARNQSITAQADLAALLGDEKATVYRLVDDTKGAPPPAPTDAAPLIQQAFTARPDLMALKQDADAAHHYAQAEHDLSRPTVTALGAAGGSPDALRSSGITTNWYGAAGVNVSIPIFNGFLYSARAQEANLKASAADQQVRELRDNIARDVTTTVLQAQSNFNRIAVAQQLADQSNAALQLAQTRYKLGLSSIVELSQAQLLQTQAAIELTNARYAYQGSLAAIRYQTGQ